MALIMALWGGLGLGIYWDHETQSRQVRVETANLANALSEQVNRVLREADQLARMIEWEVQKNGLALPLQDYARHGAIKMDVFFQISVIDPNGNLTASTRPEFPKINVRDREYFLVHATRDSDELFISKPLIGRVSRHPSIRLSRRINRLDGSFGGVIAISLDATYFTNFYKELSIGKTGQISIVGTYDRLFRVRRNDSEDSGHYHASLPYDSNIYQAMLAAPGGVVQSRGISNQRPRLYGYDKLSDYPLTVTVGFSEAEVMAPYNARRDFMIALGLIFTFLIASAETRRVGLLQRLYRTVEAEHNAVHLQQQKNDRLNSMFKAIPDGVLIFTDEGNIERGNQVTAQLLGLNADALDLLPTLDFAELFFREDITPERERKTKQLSHLLLNAQNEDAPEYFTVAIERPALSVFEFHIRHSRSGFSGGVAVIRDVTAQSQLDRMKSDFISTAAHELRTPMAGILGFAELLKAGRITSEQHEDVFDVLHERAKTLNDILSELLDLARLEARANKDFDYERINLARLCRDILDADPVFATRVTLTLDRDDIWLRGDRPKLVLALRNLIENAIKYSPPEGAIQLLANLGNSGRRVRIEVEDEGIGMSEEESSRAFEKFYRADKSGTVPGTGLGLALVREIVILHGGTISLLSQPQRGTIVTIELDVA
ncbi:MAG TPA: ATP-binding protein [Herbaspirillum sp.]|jgi:signal transduction histidine kinase